MNTEERMEQAEKERVILAPKVAGADDIPEGQPLPLSLRQYDPLEVVRPEILATAKAMMDNEDTVIAPLGGMVRISNCDLGNGPAMDDLVPVPTISFKNPTYTPLDIDQIPMMIDEKPPIERSGEKEFDFGRQVEYRDYVDSAIGQEKPVEQVLAIPAWPFIKSSLSQDYSNDNLNFNLYGHLTFLRRGWCEKDERFVQLLPYITFWKIVNNRIQIFVYQRGKGVGEERLAMGCSIGVGGHINPHDFFSTQSKLQKFSTPSGPDVHSIRTSRMLCEGFWTGILNNVLREGSEEVKIEMPATEGMVPVDLQNFIMNEASLEGKTMEKWLFDRTSFFLDYAASDVEKVHLAMPIAIRVPDDFQISTNEEELFDVGFVDLEALYHDDASKVLPTPLECWSRSIVNSLYETIKFTEENKAEDWFYGSKFIRENIREAGQHPIHPEAVAKIPQADRWKIGTLAGSFDEAYRFYAMNTFFRV